jgi:hypothetical protein
MSQSVYLHEIITLVHSFWKQMGGGYLNVCYDDPYFGLKISDAYFLENHDTYPFSDPNSVGSNSL